MKKFPVFSSLMGCPSREQHSLLLAKKLAVQCPSPSWDWGSQPQGLQVAVTQEAIRGQAALLLSEPGAPVASGFPSPCPGCDLHSRVPWRPHTQQTVVFPRVYWRETEFKRNSSEITKCQTSHSWVQSIPKFIPDSTHGSSGPGSHRLGVAALVSLCPACLPASHLHPGSVSPLPPDSEFSFWVTGRYPPFSSPQGRGMCWYDFLHRFWWKRVAFSQTMKDLSRATHDSSLYLGMQMLTHHFPLRKGRVSLCAFQPWEETLFSACQFCCLWLWRTDLRFRRS